MLLSELDIARSTIFPDYEWCHGHFAFLGHSSGGSFDPSLQSIVIIREKDKILKRPLAEIRKNEGG